MTSWIDYFDAPDERVAEPQDLDDSDLEMEFAIVPVDDTELARRRDTNFPFDARAPVLSAEDDKPLPLQAWQNVVSNAAPSAPPAVNLALPAASLELDWIYGFNSSLRNVVRYVSAAKIVYPAGAAVVVYDVLEHTQSIAVHHADRVQALAVHPTISGVVATGERGLVPKIVVWNAFQSPGTTLSVIRGLHRSGITQLAWMPNGRTLVTIGQDEFNRVAVYQWEQSSGEGGRASIEWARPPTLTFADRSGREPVHALAVVSMNQFVTAGRRHIFFWTRESDDRYTSANALFFKRPGVLGRKAKVQTLLSLATLPSDTNVVVAGSARGQILLFEGRNVIKVLHAHAGAVNVLFGFAGGVLSGGRDGKLRLWSKRMEPGAQFDLDALGSVCTRIKSAVSSPDGGAKLLVATAGAEIFELATSDGANLHFGAMVCGHFAHELHGLAVHPVKSEFCTAGDDHSVRVWDMRSHRQVRMTLLEAPVRACSYSPDGSLVAVGQGAPPIEDSPHLSRRLGKLLTSEKQGAFCVLGESTLAVKYEAKDSKKHIRTIRFAADGLTLAVGSNDNFVYAYNTEDWASKGKCKARDNAVVLSHVDFSATGEYLMANASNKREMVFFEMSSGVEITRIATLKDAEWATWTCPYGWPVQGVWPSTQAKAYDVSAVARSASGSVAPLLVAGDTFGTVRLFRYPCVSNEALCQVARAACSPITAVQFSADNSLVVACAQEEACVFQWRVEYEEQDPSAESLAGGGAQEFEYHPTSDDELEMSAGTDRTPFYEAASLGEFALDCLSLQQQHEQADSSAAIQAPAPQPTKSWVASSIAPAEAPDEHDLENSTVPNENLELEWVYGFRCHDARNNVFLTRARNLLVFPAANVVVLQDCKLWLQRHFRQHTDEVTSIALHLSAGASGRGKKPTTADATSSDRAQSSCGSAQNLPEIVASGQMGKYPVIHIWRVDTLEVLVSLRGFHRRGIAELRFNAAGNLLASVGLDPQSSLAIYDWQSGVLLANAAASGVGRVLGLCFQQEIAPDPQAAVRTASAGASNSTSANSSSGTVVVTVGVKTLTFWRLAGQTLVKKDAVLGKKGLRQTFLSVVFCGKDAVVGTTSGDLYRFKGLELMSIVPAHARSIAALYCVPKSPHHIVSGGKDGLVKLWSSDLECLSEFSEFNTAKHPIRSVFWDYDRNTLVVGTRGASIHQLSSLDGAVLPAKTPDGVEVGALEAHSKHELHGLSVCYSKDRFCTTGDDAVLRVWDLMRHVQVLAKSLETCSRACAYSYDGDFIAVGLGGGPNAKRHKKDGSLLVFEDRNMSVELVYETRDTKQSISVVQFSPDGQSLVVGAYDNSIYIYDVPSNYTKRAVFNKHKSFITHLDISSDSQYIRSNCGGFELLFADITTGSHVASATALRSQLWETCSTVYNWFNQGVWPVMASSAATIDVTASACSLPGASEEIARGGAVLIAGTSHGVLNMFKYPCFVRGAACKRYVGHSGAIAQLGFTGPSTGGAHCLSIGQQDRCIFQWRKTRARVPENSLNATSVLKDPEPDEDLAIEGLFMPESFLNLAPQEVKPYLSAIMPPSGDDNAEPSEQDGAASQCSFELEHVFGFRSYDVRNNAVYTKTKHVVLHTGSLGVRYDRRSHSQTFYRNHTRPIVSLAATSDGSFVATGEMCSENLQQEQPRIHIWEPSSCTTVAVLSAFHSKAVSYLAFNGTGTMLATIGQDEFHSLAVYNSTTGLWFDGALLASSKTTRQAVFFVAFLDDRSSGYDIISGGQDHALFWKLDAPNLQATFGVFGKKAQQQPLLCGASLGTLAVTGCSTGHLYVWESCVVSRVVPAHTGAVYALHATSKGFVSGGRDGHVKVWSTGVAPLADFDVNEFKPASHNAVVRSLCWDTAEDRVLIGTKGGEVLELSRLTGTTSVVTESHFDSRGLFGLCAHPLRPEIVATAGEDQTVRVWDLTKRQVIAKLTLDGSLRCVAYSPDGKVLVVGFGSSDGGLSGSAPSNNKNGAFAVLDATTLDLVHEGRDSKQSLLSLAFAPDLTLLAVGSADHCVYVYSPLDNFALRFKFAKASGQVLHLDFASDSSVLRLNSDAWELLFMSSLDGSQIHTPSSVKDVTWATHSCVFAWAVQGLWDFAQDTADIFVHTVARAHSSAMLAAGNNKGEIRVYNAPCLSKRTEQHVLKGHSLNVSGVAFTCDDSRLVTIGASDKSLFVWRVARPET